jgi:3'(2'), 5'-bisphosphate nucleotidase
MEQLLLIAIGAAMQAGQSILEIYETEFVVEHKADNSPLTLADRRSHQILVDHLVSTHLPILSEEGRDLPYEERRAWHTFWLLDPLDGTKEFVKRNGEFTVNIALIRKSQPVMGVIYVPVQDVLYFGATDWGAYKLTGAANQIASFAEALTDKREQFQNVCHVSQRLPLGSMAPGLITVVGSRSHSTPEVQQIVDNLKKQHDEVNLISAGSSLKICMVAEGRAHLYPRTGPTMEWDTAAGQAIAEAAGARLLVFDTEEPLRYNKENLRNPWFVVQSAAMDRLS